MAADTLRAELEAAYSAVVEAVRAGDCEAFIAAVLPPAPGTEDAMRADFERSSDLFRQLLPDLAHTTFVAVRAESDDLAAYFHARPDLVNLSKAQLILTPFVRVEGCWKLLLKGILHTFDYDFLDDDLRDRARHIVETHPGLRLEPPPTQP